MTGSKTGPDGSGGNATSRSRRKSGRVKIDPAAWFRNGKVPVGYEIKWKVLPMFADVFESPKSIDPAREAITTVVQGIPNAKHTLELSSDSPPAIKAIRVYRPAVKTDK